MAQTASPDLVEDNKSPVDSVSPVSDEEKAEYHVVDHQDVPVSKAESKAQDHLQPQSPKLDEKTLSSASSTPLKDSFPDEKVDEEKVSSALT